MHYGSERTYGARIDDGWTYRGLKTLILENELIRVTVTADKGADISSFIHKPSDTEFLWRSPWGVRDPRLYVSGHPDPNAVWIDYYQGGWQVVLPGGGNPSVYRGASIGQHGEANLLPWDATITEDSEERVAASFFVRLPRMPLEVRRDIRLSAGSSVLEVSTEVRNLGAEDLPMVFGEHIALGAPFLSGDCVIDIPGGTVNTHPTEYSGRNRWKAGQATAWPESVLKDGSEASMREVPPDGAGFDDQAYIGDMPDGWYAVTNKATGIGWAVRFPKEVFKYLWYWQMFSGGTGYPWWGRTYTAGLEPFTSFPNLGLQKAIENGTAHMLGAGQTLKTQLTVCVFHSSKGVRSVAEDGTVTTLD